MGRARPTPKVALAVGLAWVLAGCNGDALKTQQRSIEASVILLELPKTFGSAERPAVEFKHAKHTQALEDQGCKTCHLVDQKQRVLPRLNWKDVPADQDDWRLVYHGTCIGCHEERAKKDQKTGPADCGDCHLPRASPVSKRQAMRLDYSLHQRHVLATKSKCETCHHIYDENLKKLISKKGTESNCYDCHADKDQGKNLSGRNAAHLDCINCHLRKKETGQKSGPWLCMGCHSRDAQAKIEKLVNIPRLKRDQPNVTWIKKPPEAAARLVAFDHRFHETQTSACSDCHHRTLKPCQDCHTLDAGVEGGGVTLEQAYHMHSSTFSCVGCHHKHSEKSQCAGCHDVLARPPGRLSCEICHNGPLPALAQTTPPESALTQLDLEPLPKSSEDFPEQVQIKVLAKAYLPSEFPHRKIVAKLNNWAGQSKLASRFHGKTQVLCTGCHHHSPMGSRYPACRACHGSASHPTKDVPGLLAAYHRQCIGCHQRIGHKAQGCEDCHKKASQEVRE